MSFFPIFCIIKAMNRRVKKVPRPRASSRSLEKPLLAIMKHISLLLKGEAGDVSIRQSDYLLTIRKQSEFLRSMIQTQLNLLDRELATEAKQRRLAEEQAQAFKQEYQELLSLVTHDLRTPLTVIIGYTRMMLGGMSGKLNRKQIELLSTINREADAEYKLVNRVIEHASAQLERKILQPVSFNLRQAMGPLLAANPDKIFLTSEHPDIKVHADKHIIIRILKDILEVAGSDIAGSGNYVRISLREEGSGVRIIIESPGLFKAIGDISEVFDKYFQVNKDTVGRWKLRLKLYVAKHFIEAHKGKFFAEGDKLIIILPKFECIKKEVRKK